MLYFKIETDSPAPIGFMFQFLQLGKVGNFRPLIAGVILGSVYIVMLTDMVNRMNVAIIGSFVALAALSGIHGTESLKAAMEAMDISTLGLLFGLMILVQVLATTGGLERMAYYAVVASKGRPFVLLCMMCMICFCVSCFLPSKRLHLSDSCKRAPSSEFCCSGFNLFDRIMLPVYKLLVRRLRRK